MPKTPSSSLQQGQGCLAFHAESSFPDSLLFPNRGIGTGGIPAHGGIGSQVVLASSPFFAAPPPDMISSDKASHAPLYPPLASSSYSALLLGRTEKTIKVKESSSSSVAGIWPVEEDSISIPTEMLGGIIHVEKFRNRIPVQELGCFRAEETSSHIPVNELGSGIYVDELGSIHSAELGGILMKELRHGIHAEALGGIPMELGGIQMEESGRHVELAFECKYLDNGVHLQSSRVYLPIRSDIGHGNSTLAHMATSYSAPSSPPTMVNSDCEKYYDYSAENTTSGDRNTEILSDRPLPSPCGIATTTPIKKAQGGKHQPRFAFQTRTDIDILDDGYKWRKYGQKAVKNNTNPRSYYRCTHVKCNVKKRVERLAEDREIVVTSYQGIHNHYARETNSNYVHPVSTNYLGSLSTPSPLEYYYPITTNIPDTLNHLFTTHHT